MRLSLAMVLLLLTAACTRWPVPGRGGWAERHPLAMPAEGDVLGERLLCEKLRLEDRRQAAAREGILTGQIARLDGIAARVHREYTTGLIADAQGTLEVLRRESDAIQPALPPGTPFPAECP